MGLPRVRVWQTMIAVALKVRQGDPSWKREAARQRRETALWRYWTSYWDQLRRKYEDAAAHPWHSVEPDPPMTDPGVLVTEPIDG
jgi:hypothetical protein